MGVTMLFGVLLFVVRRRLGIGWCIRIWEVSLYSLSVGNIELKQITTYTNAAPTRFNGFSSNVLTSYVDRELPGQV